MNEQQFRNRKVLYTFLSFQCICVFLLLFEVSISTRSIYVRDNPNIAIVATVYSTSLVSLLGLGINIPLEEITELIKAIKGG